MSTATETPETDQPKLQMSMDVAQAAECIRQVVVTIPESEVKRYFKKEYDELVPEAQLPGFRSGRAPRKLVEKQFKERVTEKVKNGLLMDSLGAVSETDKFNAIGEPDFDYDAVKIPESGDFKFQFEIEVRPEFKTPDWKGIALTKPVEEIGEEEIQTALNRVLLKYCTWEATDEPAELGDRLVVNIQFSVDGKRISSLEEERITLARTLSFSDAVCEDFGGKLVGVKEDDTREFEVRFSENLDNEFAGKTATASVEVVEVLKAEQPAMNDDFLRELGDFENEKELHDFVEEQLTRQADYRVQQAVRQSVVELLTNNANFDLPPGVVKRQANRELQRKVLELRRSGFDDDLIRKYVNATQRNITESTKTALREHFILEQIAEDENIDADEAEYEAEMELIASQRDVPVRRVRAQLEREGQMDALRNQIVERKVIELVVANAKVTEEKVKTDQDDGNGECSLEFAVSAIKDHDVIPEAKYEDNATAKSDDDKTP
ncbi:MAG: trigger factor [Planctomycetota bacterium]